MAEGAQVKVEGVQQLVATLKRAGADMRDLKNAHAAVARIVASAAADRAPRRTGKLSGSIRPTRQARRARVTVGRSSVPYAAPIHWGWPARRIEANPFVSDAAQATEGQWVDVYRREVAKALVQVKGV